MIDREIEKIHTSAWISSDGGYGQFLINYNTEEVECDICLPEGNYKLYENDFRILSGGSQNIKVKKLSAIMFERD